MPGAFDGCRKPLLLLVVQTALGSWFDLSVHVDETLQGFDVFVVKILWRVFFESSGHKGSFQEQNVEYGILDCRIPFSISSVQLVNYYSDYKIPTSVIWNLCSILSEISRMEFPRGRSACHQCLRSRHRRISCEALHRRRTRLRRRLRQARRGRSRQSRQPLL